MGTTIGVLYEGGKPKPADVATKDTEEYLRDLGRQLGLNFVKDQAVIDTLVVDSVTPPDAKKAK
jgi:hypothetical protein